MPASRSCLRRRSIASSYAVFMRCLSPSGLFRALCSTIGSPRAKSRGSQEVPMKGSLKLVLLLVLLLLAGGVGFVMAKVGVGSRIATANLPEAERRFAERMEN